MHVDAASANDAGDARAYARRPASSVGTRHISREITVDLRTFHPGGVALGRRRVRHEAVALPSAGRPDVAALLTGSSMRILEAGLALVAIATAILLGIGR